MRLLSVLLSVTLVLASAAWTAPTAAQPAPDDSSPQPTNIILLIPDGFGPASGTMARDYLRWQSGTTELALDSLQRGSVRTFSTSSRVTDSAAGATAYSTGTKTYNGAIAVDTTKRPLATVLEAAERKGLATGLVATSRLTHATPAAFSVHFEDRWMENQIDASQITKDIDVLLGGGRRHFLPQSADGSDREDGRHLIDEARSNGYQYVSNRNELMSVTTGPVLGLFSNSHMSYEIDRDPSAQPSLAEMTRKAIDIVSQDEDGFFLMVEGSRIDHAGHENDAAAHLHDILAFNKAVETALSFAKANGNTLVVNVSDHETGGMSLGRSVDGEGIYAWKPSLLDRVTASHAVIIDSLQTALDALPKTDDDGEQGSHDRQIRTLRPIVEHFTGITDFSDAETSRLRSSVGNDDALGAALTEIIGRRTLVGWTTGGHTAVDVNLYAFGPGSQVFTGNHDNTYVGQAIARLLGADLSALTREMRSAPSPDPSTEATETTESE